MIGKSTFDTSPRWPALLGLLWLVPAMAGPATRATAPGPAWPPPPDEPRVVYVRSFTQPADLGIRRPALKRFVNWIAGTANGNEKFVKPFGIALDDQGGLCLTDTGANVVCYCDQEKKRWYRWDHVGKIQFASPVAVVKKGSMLVVADSVLAKVIAFDTDGNPIFQINYGPGRPSGLAFIGERLYVADVEKHCVAIFDLKGNPVSSFGRRGTGPGEFNFPTHLATDREGHLLVTDSLNSRVQVFDRTGKFLARIGSAGDTSGHFGRPKGVAVDTFGHVYVTDAIFDNIQIFDLSGRLLLSLGGNGTGPGEFAMPGGIVIGADNQIYVADSFNHRIQVFKYVGQQ
jgi:DNA-binding beta-propeller fold protein YncE